VATKGADESSSEKPAQHPRKSARLPLLRHLQERLLPWRPMQRGRLRGRILAALVPVVLFAGACGATASPSTAASRSPRPTPAPVYPPVPAGGTDCGIYDAIRGWPTTIAPGPTIYACLAHAFMSGRPARLVLISPSSVDSGRTSDGYPVPAAILVTYRVLGPGRLQVTTDRRHAGGSVTTRNCTGLSLPAPASPPAPSGCEPG